MVNSTRGYNICKYYTHNIGTPKYVKQVLTDIKEKTNRNKIFVGDLNIPLTSMDRSSRQKINKETLALNGILD